MPLSGVGSDRISIHHCLFAHNADRVPKLEGGVYDVVNNVFYNWGRNNAAKIEAGARVNLVNNWFLPGADSTPQSGCVFPADPDKGAKVYLSGNVGPFTSNCTSGKMAWVWFPTIRTIRECPEDLICRLNSRGWESRSCTRRIGRSTRMTPRRGWNR
jgi:hypothetical protein